VGSITFLPANHYDDSEPQPFVTNSFTRLPWYPRSIKALRPILAYLRDLGVTPPQSPATCDGPVDEMAKRYRRYLTVERGLGETARE
jgi:hypothetical protein